MVTTFLCAECAAGRGADKAAGVSEMQRQGSAKIGEKYLAVPFECRGAQRLPFSYSRLRYLLPMGANARDGGEVPHYPNTQLE